jgi:diacylglycerol kinase (ATP)
MRRRGGPDGYNATLPVLQVGAPTLSMDGFMSSSSGMRNTEATVIWNPAAGSTGRAENVRRTLNSQRGVELMETGSPEEAAAGVEAACRAGVPRVIAAGGDGTVNTVVTALAAFRRDHGRASTLAVLPLGTGNDLARSLGMPLNPTEAMKLCLTGPARPIDVLELDRGDGDVRLAANMVTAGNTGKYIQVLTDELKQRWGALCYVRGAVDILEELEVFRVELTIDDERPITVNALNLFFANGKTSGGGMTVCADACLNDGQLDLLVIRDGTGLDLATLTVDYLVSDLRDSELVLHRRCRRVSISGPSLIPLSTDGDPAKASRFAVAIHPAAIQAVVGA